MDCREYIDEFLSAHADGELSAEQERLARQHIGGCPACRQRLADEQALKQMVHKLAAGTRAPAAVNARVRAALVAESRRRTAGALDLREARRAMRDARRRPASLSRSPLRIVAPLAVAAAVVIVLLLARGRGIEPGLTPQGSAVAATTVLNSALARYVGFQTNFAPNMPSASLDALSDAYRAAGMPDTLWDFSASDFRLVGGRLEHRTDGRMATYTLYRNGSGDSIMCSFLSRATMSDAPTPVTVLGPLRFYHYRGYSVCVNEVPGMHCLCVLVTKQPMRHLMLEVLVSKLGPEQGKKLAAKLPHKL